MTVTEAVKRLVGYGIEKELIVREEAVWAANGICAAIGFEPAPDFSVREGELPSGDLEELLKVLLDYASESGLIDGGISSRDLLDTKIMGVLMPRPGEVIRTFRALLKEDPEKATDYYYKLSCDADYIRRYRIAKDKKWVAPTPYGDLDITINLSKPEKDPKAIAAALQKKQDQYPKCLLCPENEGYAGRLDHPARQTIRLIPIKLGGADWYLQYSPYVYYNEHCIVLSGDHVPMKIERLTFVRLLDFLKLFPHYTIGSNADLPIVGGSILTHEHFQGGKYTFAMAKAPVREEITFPGFEDVEAGIVHWPMSVIRIRCADPERLVALADRILSSWRVYTDQEADIWAFSADGAPAEAGRTGAVPHNTITPIARMRGEKYELDLVLRNNRTTDAYPLGIFHPHAELHHIKKENIGLIEVMGLAVLPARLLKEMETLKAAMLQGADVRAVPEIAAHADWAEAVAEKYPDLSADNIDRIIETEIGIVFSQVLTDAGVYKDTDEGRAAMQRFIRQV